MRPNLEDTIRGEIEALHHFFVGWFSGAEPEDSFEPGFLARFDPDFLLIPPNGTVLRIADLASMLRNGYATNPPFRIVIRSVKILWELDGHVLATYEEWQRDALASKPPENARIASVLFRRSDPLSWLHIHETWLPADVAASGSYDF